MFVFCTFSLISKHTDFHFSFDILAQIMKFLEFLCGDYVNGNLAMETMTTSEKSTGEFLEIFFLNDLV